MQIVMRRSAKRRVIKRRHQIWFKLKGHPCKQCAEALYTTERHMWCLIIQTQGAMSLVSHENPSISTFNFNVCAIESAHDPRRIKAIIKLLDSDKSEDKRWWYTVFFIMTTHLLKRQNLQWTDSTKTYYLCVQSLMWSSLFLCASQLLSKDNILKKASMIHSATCFFTTMNVGTVVLMPSIIASTPNQLLKIVCSKYTFHSCFTNNYYKPQCLAV